MDAEKSLTIFNSLELFELVRDIQNRIISGYGVELTFEQVLELIKVANEQELIRSIGEIEKDISHIASE